ncbi:MAG: hypothetical protein OXK79_05525 [Chloroflexota bacterium]|nr:hypothetical protein [Chloroflexota bacterium]
MVAFATEGTIVEKLSTLTPDHTSTHRTSEALVDALTSAVDAAPVVFSSVFLTFLAVPRQYQYGLVRGLLAHRRRILAGTAKGVWDDVVWSRLFSFLEELLEDSRHRSRTPAQPPGTVDGWLTEAVADLLHEGTREDEHAYPPVFLPRGWALIEKLVSGADAVAAPSDDPMTQAINSPKGRALEAAFSHILRDCRLADRETGAHDAAWSSARRLVERELALCVNSNFEFSTLAAAYLGSFEYIDVRWLEDHIQEFFPKSYTTNLGCALGGLAYAWMSRGIYRILRDAGIVDIALQLEIKREHSRTKLMERLALGYLWEEESLDSERFAYLFEHDCTEDLQSINFFFWSIRGETLKPEQVRKVVDYWRHCVKWARDRPEPPAKVLSSLGGLSRFLESAGGEDRELLLAVAPYVDTNGNAYEFIRELVRLVETSPAEVCDVFERLVDKHELLYDYEGRIQTLVRRLADLGFRREAIDLCNKLRSLPGVVDLFRELTAESGRS